MIQPSGRQIISGSVQLGAGVASVVILGSRAGFTFNVTSLYASVGISAAQPVVVESTGGTVNLLNLVTSPTGTVGWGPLFKGIALPSGVGITATAGGAGNAIGFVFEGYYTLG